MKTSRLIFTIGVAAISCALAEEPGQSTTLARAALEQYVRHFNQLDEERYPQAVPNAEAHDFLAKNIPLFECPDKNVERTYYFRWWTYRKHIKKTPVGHIITEFLPDVSWAGNHNAIPCPGTHHYREGRWMKDPTYLRDFTNFWVHHSGNHPTRKWRHVRAVLGHGFPLSDALWQFHLVHPSGELVLDVLPELTANYEELKKARKTETGLYWSNAGGWEGDGMEVAIGGDGVRPTVNSYMVAQAAALSEMHLLQGNKQKARHYRDEADRIGKRMIEVLWDEEAAFFKVLRKKDIRTGQLADVRELLGYVPWFYSIPPKNQGYEKAWAQLMDRGGFHAPYGPTTAEQRHPQFQIAYTGHDCQWNGPSWPYATTQTLTAMANVLQDYPQEVISRSDYLDVFLNYTKSHQLHRENGEVVPWIDENLNPYTGDWIARTMLHAKGEGEAERGMAYNHSAYVDLVITGLVGLKPRADNQVEVNPTLPEGAWDWFCLDQVTYKGRTLTIIWDRFGKKYDKGQGLMVFADGRRIAHSPTLSKVVANLEG